MDEAFAAAVEVIYDTALDPARLPGALQAVAGCFGDAGATLLWWRDDGSVGSIASPSVAAEQADYEGGGWSANDLRARRAAERGYIFRGEPFTDRHVCSDDEMATDPIYTRFLPAHGLRWFGAVSVSPEPRLGVVLCLHRVAARPAYSDAELARIARLGRHAEQALRLGMRLADAEILRVGLGEALGRVGIGVFCLDNLGRVLSANPAGQRLLGDGLEVVNGRLLLGATPARAVLTQMLGEGGGLAPQADPKPIVVLRDRTARPVVVYLMPVPRRVGPEAGFLARAHAIALALTPDAEAPADPALVRDVLGLTLGEARMAALVGAGLAPQDASEKLGITPTTGRSVLKQVFAKTGVSRQSELALLLTRLVIR